MPLMPKRVKYRKTQRGSRKGIATRNLKIDFGEFGLQTLERAWITNTQIEAARVALTRNMKRKGKLWIRILIGIFSTLFWDRKKVILVTFLKIPQQNY